MAATRAQSEVAPSLPSASHVTQAASTPNPLPPRRTTTRTRKLPSRLLPSPSPPPSRTASSSSHSSKLIKSNKDVASTPFSSSSTAGIQSNPKSRRVSKNSAPLGSSDSSISELSLTSKHEENDADSDNEQLGLGKRKRRPSTMYQPLSTLTGFESPSAYAASKLKKKFGSPSPDSLEHGSLVCASFSSSKHRARFSKSISDKKSSLTSVPEHAYESDGGNPNQPSLVDDSDMEVESVSLVGTKPCASSNQHAYQLFELSPPPLLPRDGSARLAVPAHLGQPTFIKSGRVSISPESAFKKARLNRKRSNDSSWHLSDKPTNHPTNSQPPWRMVDMLSSSSLSPAPFTAVGFTQPQPVSFVPFNAAAAAYSPLLARPPFDPSLQQEADSGAEEDDVDDFHEAMLDGDFDLFDSQKVDGKASPGWSTSGARTSADGEIDDTPATTPRSPQSGCDLPTPTSPRYKSDESCNNLNKSNQAAFSGIRDNVFVHALPTTLVGADKPHQHAGSLTLSLPYSPEAATASPRLKSLDLNDGIESHSGEKRSNHGLDVRFTTPIIERRSQVSANGQLTSGLPGSLKFSIPHEGKGVASGGASQFLQLSPGIDIDSPLLSPTLGLGLPGKPEPPSPFCIGDSNLTELEPPPPLSLPPPQPTAVVSSQEKSDSKPCQSFTQNNTSGVSVTQTKPNEVMPLSSVPGNQQAKADIASIKRPSYQVLPPPRHISFTFTTSDSSNQVPLMTSCVTPQPCKSTQPVVTCIATDSTPEPSHSSSETSSDSSSPISRADSDVLADAEVETLLFGPPEKLDLKELDQVWGGPAGTDIQLSRPTPPYETIIPSAMPTLPTHLRRAKVTRIHHVDLTPQ